MNAKINTKHSLGCCACKEKEQLMVINNTTNISHLAVPKTGAARGSAVAEPAPATLTFRLHRQGIKEATLPVSAHNGIPVLAKWLVATATVDEPGAGEAALSLHAPETRRVEPPLRRSGFWPLRLFIGGNSRV